MYPGILRGDYCICLYCESLAFNRYTFLMHAKYLCSLIYLPFAQIAGFQLNVVLKQVGMKHATVSSKRIMVPIFSTSERQYSVY